MVEDLGEALTMHCARESKKLRWQRLAASHLTLFVSTARFSQNPDEIYSAAASWRIPFPTSDTPALVEASHTLLDRVYKPGFVYQKAGEFLTDIVAAAERQQSLVSRIDGERHLRLMEAVDRINRRYGRRTMRTVAMGTNCPWEMKRGRLSGRYTTRLNEVLKVKAS